MVSPGVGVVLSTLTVMPTSADGGGEDTLIGGVEALIGVVPPSVRGVGVLIVAVFATLPVAPLTNVPRIWTFLFAPAATSGNTILPAHADHVAPPSILYCGFCTAAGTWSLTVGVCAGEGPLLLTVMV
jgi:hypothetical protein